jgi:CRP-like cAMP-binding protein
VARFEVPVTLDVGVPTERAQRLLLAGAMSAIGPGGPVEQPAPKVLLASVSHQGVEYLVRYWIRVGQVPPNTVRSRVLEAVLGHLVAAGIEPAYPKEEVFYARQGVHDFGRDSPEQRVALLDRIELLARSLQPDEIARLAERMARCTFRRGDLLLRQGDPGQSMLVLAEGLVEVVVRGKDGLPERRLSRVEPGQCVGEMSLLTGGPRSATVRALTDVVAYEISKEHIEPLIESRPALAGTLSWLVAERRLQAVQAMVETPADEAGKDTSRLSEQILTRMRSFFRGVRETRAG